MLRDENRVAPSNATLRQFCEAVEGCALPPDTVLAAAVVRGSQSTVSVFPIAQLREVATIIRRRIAQNSTVRGLATRVPAEVIQHTRRA